MTSDSINALKRMVKERTNPEESRNALLQLLKRNSIDPDEVMEFVDAYKEHQQSKQQIDMPQNIKVYIAINYNSIIESIKKGYNYCPMVLIQPMAGPYYDEIFEIDLPLAGYKQVPAKKVSL